MIIKLLISINQDGINEMQEILFMVSLQVSLQVIDRALLVHVVHFHKECETYTCIFILLKLLSLQQ